LSVAVSIIISLLALLATFYQLYLQRVHNEKSLKPLGQIDLLDHKDRVVVEVRNNGLGPLIVEKLKFKKAGTVHDSIEDCISLAPASYMRLSKSVSWPRVVQPNACLIVFETVFEDNDDSSYRDHVKSELSPITIEAICRDIYGHKTILNRDFKGFARYSSIKS
jgi:hypothetical protein